MRVSVLIAGLMATVACGSESGSPSSPLDEIGAEGGGAGGGASSMSGRVLGVAVAGQGAVPVGNAIVEVVRLGEIPRGEFSRSDYQSGPDAVPECEMRGTRVEGATATADGDFLVGAVSGGLFALRATAPEGSSFSVPGAICYFPIAGDSAFLGIEIRVREPGATLPGSGSGPGTGADSTG